MEHETNRSGAVAVVGAGMAGLACATTLAEAGRPVTLFDKGRRPGGRIATRRADGVMFDHGAQFATARGAGLRTLFEAMQHAGDVAPWPAAQRADDIAWVGVPGMSALPRAMAERAAAAGVRLHTERHVSYLHGHGTVRHHSANDARPGSTSDTGGDTADGFAAVLLALPAPQAAPLLQTLHHPFAASLAGVVIAPCWAVMLSFAEAQPGPDAQRLNSGPLGWIARGSSRPGAQAGPDTTPDTHPDTWVLHATAAWSRAHLEDDAASVTEALLDCFRAITGATATPRHASAHRWRHALVETPLGTPCLWDAAVRIGVCGDWCLGARVEAAYDSGVALARAVLADSPMPADRA